MEKTDTAETKKIWTGKRVYIKLKNSTRCYSGYIIDETSTSITLLDINNNRVMLALESLEILQEQPERNGGVR
jgi:hypothetical protein